MNWLHRFVLSLLIGSSVGLIAAVLALSWFTENHLHADSLMEHFRNAQYLEELNYHRPFVLFSRLLVFGVGLLAAAVSLIIYKGRSGLNASSIALLTIGFGLWLEHHFSLGSGSVMSGMNMLLVALGASTAFMLLRSGKDDPEDGDWYIEGADGYIQDTQESERTAEPAYEPVESSREDEDSSSEKEAEKPNIRTWISRIIWAYIIFRFVSRIADNAFSGNGSLAVGILVLVGSFFYFTKMKK